MKFRIPFLLLSLLLVFPASSWAEEPELPSAMEKVFNEVDPDNALLLPDQGPPKFFYSMAGVADFLRGKVEGRLFLFAYSEATIEIRHQGGQWSCYDPGGKALAIEDPAEFAKTLARVASVTELINCKSNLKNIATALEMWSTDHEGAYPKTLAELTPEYLKYIPTCPAAGKDSYSDRYAAFQAQADKTVNGEKLDYFFGCAGHHHANLDIPAEYPDYNSVRGLSEGP